MRLPRRAAVLLSTLALTGTVVACGGDDGESSEVPAPGVREPGVDTGTLPPGTGETEIVPSP